MSNFNYCPLVWHFCGKKNNQNIEKIQERALRILYGDYISTYDGLLEKAGTNTLLIIRLRLMALTVFKSLNSLNPPCLNDIFAKKSVPYRMRDSCILEQPKRRTTTFGLISFSHVGAKVWNELPTYLKETSDLNDCKSLLDTWNGPDLIDTTFSYFWYNAFYIYNSLRSLHCLILSHVSWSLFIHKHFISLMCICMHLCMCVCACI